MSLKADQNDQDNEQVRPRRVAIEWSWLPTLEGALRREEVTSFTVKRIDGDFKGGHKSLWSIYVITAAHDEPVRLRPHFFDPVELCIWVDRVFPGSAFELLPPSVITDAPQLKAASEGQETRNLFAGGKPSDAIRIIGDGLAGGNDYEPPQGYHPPPGTHVAI